MKMRAWRPAVRHDIESVLSERALSFDRWLTHALAFFRGTGVPVVGAQRRLHRIIEQAVAEFGEVDVTRDVIFTQRRVGGLAEEGRKAIDETHVARGRPITPVRDLDAVPIACHDIVRPWIDDEREAALPFPAEGHDAVEIGARDVQPAPAPTLQEGRIDRPAGPRTADRPCVTARCGPGPVVEE